MKIKKSSYLDSGCKEKLSPVAKSSRQLKSVLFPSLLEWTFNNLFCSSFTIDCTAQLPLIASTLAARSLVALFEIDARLGNSLLSKNELLLRLKMAAVFGDEREIDELIDGFLANTSLMGVFWLLDTLLARLFRIAEEHWAGMWLDEVFKRDESLLLSTLLPFSKLLKNLLCLNFLIVDLKLLHFSLNQARMPSSSQFSLLAIVAISFALKEANYSTL